MTITNKAGSDNAAGQTQMASALSKAGAAPASAPTQNQAQTPAFSWLRPASLVSAPLARNAAAEILTKLTKAAEKIIEDNSSTDMEIKLIGIDQQNAEEQIGMSVLTVAVRFKGDMAGMGVGYQNLLLEGSIDRSAPTTVNVNGQQIEVIKNPANIDTKELRQLTTRKVAVAFGLNNTDRIYDAMSCVVPRIFNPDDVQKVRELLVNATTAGANLLQRHQPDFVDLNLAQAAGDATLVIQTEFHQPEVVDATGLPVRGDFKIDLSAEPIRRPDQNRNDPTTPPRKLATIRGFVNMIYAPENTRNNFGQLVVANPNVSPYQTYGAQVRLTIMEPTFAQTPGSLLMALWVAMSIRDNGAWVAAFENKSFEGRGGLNLTKDIDLKDIGAIGYEVNMSNDPNAAPMLIPTKTASFTRASLGNLIGNTFKQGTMISLDVPDAGESTWYAGLFAAAAEGLPEAREQILRAADQLTNSNFRTLFPHDAPIFDADWNSNDINRIHFGYFVDADGVRHDLREIDYLAVLNFAGIRQPALVQEWSDTFTNKSMPVEIRLATRLKIMRMMYNEVVVTGLGYSLTFHAPFLNALSQAAVKTNLRVSNLSQTFDVSGTQRSVGSFGGALLDAAGNSGFTRGGFSQNTATGGNNAYSGGRWR